MQLKRLDLSGCHLSAMAVMATLDGCSALTHLRLQHFSIDGPVVEAVASHGSRLLELDLCNSAHVPGEAVQAVAQRCSELRALRLGTRKVSNPIIQAFAIKAVAQGCGSLVVLDLSGCRLTDAAVVAVATGCPLLEELSLAQGRHWDGRSGQPAAGIIMMTVSRSAARCGGWLTDKAATVIANSCARLRQLDLRFNPALTDASIQALARGCTRLVQLDLRGLERLTDGSLAAIREAAWLRELRVSGCSLLTEGAIAGLPEDWWVDVAPRGATQMSVSLRVESTWPGCGGQSGQIEFRLKSTTKLGTLMHAAIRQARQASSVEGTTWDANRQAFYSLSDADRLSVEHVIPLPITARDSPALLGFKDGHVLKVYDE